MVEILSLSSLIQFSKNKRNCSSSLFISPRIVLMNIEDIKPVLTGGFFQVVLAPAVFSAFFFRKKALSSALEENQ